MPAPRRGLAAWRRACRAHMHAGHTRMRRGLHGARTQPTHTPRCACRPCPPAKCFTRTPSRTTPWQPRHRPLRSASSSLVGPRATVCPPVAHVLAPCVCMRVCRCLCAPCTSTQPSLAQQLHGNGSSWPCPLLAVHRADSVSKLPNSKVLVHCMTGTSRWGATCMQRAHYTAVGCQQQRGGRCPQRAHPPARSPRPPSCVYTGPSVWGLH